MKIKNEQVKQIYDQWNDIWRSTNVTLEHRLRAFSVLKVIESLVVAYELQEKIGEEEIDDLFMAWDEKMRPIFPEDRASLLARLKKSKRNE